MSQKEIILHFFNYYGYYSGSYYPREHYNSGYMILKQSEFYLDEKKRLALAKIFVEGAGKNVLKILKYYNRREAEVSSSIEQIEKLIDITSKQIKLEKLMAVEGKIKNIYYSTLNEIIKNPLFEFKRRTKQPPGDRINSLISFANSMIYIYVLSEIYQTHLDPRIGYLHSTNFRSFTLNLDVAEIFKPVIGDRTIFQVVNKKILKENDFEKVVKGILLNDKGKKKFLEKIEERLNSTIKHSALKKNVSYKRLIRLELYKIEKHLMGEKEYKPFVMEW